MILEIALGIVLAVLILCYFPEILAIAFLIFLALLVIVVLGGVIFLLSQIGLTLDHWLALGGSLLVVIIFLYFISWLTGGDLTGGKSPFKSRPPTDNK